MPLVKNGKISGDAFVHVADDAPLPGDGAVLISAARFLDDPEALSRRGGRTGVIWPNKRDAHDLLPYLDPLSGGPPGVPRFPRSPPPTPPRPFPQPHTLTRPPPPT